MGVKQIFPAAALRGEIRIPGDKSISHRSIMLASLARGTSEIHGISYGADCLATIDCFRKMGIHIEESMDSTETEHGILRVHGPGLHGLKSPTDELNAGNSGTTTRLMAGILAGQTFSSTIIGDASLCRRPMGRILTPLRQMGADIHSLFENDCAPLRVHGSSLRGIRYSSPIASGQVKSAILLAGLYAEGETSVTEPTLSRNHTELMLTGFGRTVESTLHADGSASAILKPGGELLPQKIIIPGDISSASYLIAAALLVPDSEILIKQVGINPTRAGFLKICRKMGADLTLLNEDISGGEPYADLLVRSSNLKGVTIEGATIPTLIDELPILSVMGAYAEGTTTIRDAAELRVKESDRITAMVTNLQEMGADVEETPEGMIIHGGKSLHGAAFDSFSDHRIAMACSIGALAADGASEIRGGECVDISYPRFFETLRSLTDR